MSESFVCKLMEDQHTCTLSKINTQCISDISKEISFVCQETESDTNSECDLNIQAFQSLIGRSSSCRSFKRGCFNLDLIETEPLHLAAKSGDTNKVESLLRDEVECVNKKNELGFTPLHVAVKYNRESIVRLLVNSGACPNIASPQVGWTPLHIATVNFNSKLVKFLLDRKANPLVKTKFGVTALDIAVAFKFTVVIFLITKITVCVNRLIVSAVLKAGETGWLIRTATVI